MFASRSDEVVVGDRKMWLEIAKLANLPADIAPYVLRHSFTSLAADLATTSRRSQRVARPQEAQHHQQVLPFR
jgi:integrase